MTYIQPKNYEDKIFVDIDWWLGNTNNYNCSYEHPILKSGNMPWPHINTVYNFVEQLWERYCQGRNSSFNVKLTGGEVTLWEGLLPAVTRLNEKGFRTIVRTNGSGSIDLYKSLMPMVGAWEFVFHVEHADSEYFEQVLEAMQDSIGGVGISFKYLPSKSKFLDSLYTKWSQRFPKFLFSKDVVFEDPLVHKQPMRYTAEQKEQLIDKQVKPIEKDTTEETSQNEMYLEATNAFKGYMCWAGVDQFIIDARGDIYRGHCRAGGPIGKVSDSTVDLPLDPIECPFDRCFNGFDMNSKKFKE